MERNIFKHHDLCDKFINDFLGRYNKREEQKTMCTDLQKILNEILVTIINTYFQKMKDGEEDFNKA